MFAPKAEQHTDKFLLSSVGDCGPKAAHDLERLNALISNPRVRVIKEETDKETEKQFNDKGVQVSSTEYLFKIVTWVEDVL